MKWETMVLALILAAGFNSVAMATELKALKTEKPAAIAVQVTEWSGTVKSVDYVKKTAVLVDEKGKEFPVNAKNARNLDQVLVGDKVKVQYVEELVVYVRKADAPARAEAVRKVSLAPKGKMPGGIITETVQVRADVENVNYKKRTITLKNPAGETHTYNVSKEVKRLKEIKKGDQVVLDVTQALALEVVKP
jgi:Cu/Ag efflux protein CusF